MDTDPEDLTAANCDESRRIMLDLMMSSKQRARLTAAIAHVERCSNCAGAMKDFDQIGKLLSPVNVEEEISTGDWVDRAIFNLPRAPHYALKWPARAVAVCILLGLVSLAYWSGRVGNHEAMMQAATIDLPIAPKEMASRALAFEQVSKAFDNCAGWLLVSDTASDVGLEANPSTIQRMLLLRLTVIRRSSTAQKRSIASAADLVILPGRSAKLSLPFSKGQVLSYDISVDTGSPTRLALMAELHAVNRTTDSPDNQPLAALATTLDLRPGVASSAGSFVTGTSGYELSVAFSSSDPTGEKRQ